MREVNVLCARCNQSFMYQRARLDGGRTRKFCDCCRELHRKQSQKKSSDRYRMRKGHNVGVGSGGNQWGENNPTWRGGIAKSYYRKVCFDAHGTGCIHCGWEPATEEDLPRLTAHHRDGNRRNNVPENLAPVCKSCHQNIEHPSPRDSAGRYCRIEIAE